eukprot:m.135376 g.135376  ORF g.135376 m.135376 type:complete len:315 (-) comp16560_c0_seq1:721-1665(-)
MSSHHACVCVCVGTKERCRAGGAHEKTSFGSNSKSTSLSDDAELLLLAWSSVAAVAAATSPSSSGMGETVRCGERGWVGSGLSLALTRGGVLVVLVCGRRRCWSRKSCAVWAASGRAGLAWPESVNRGRLSVRRGGVTNNKLSSPPPAPPPSLSSTPSSMALSFFSFLPLLLGVATSRLLSIWLSALLDLLRMAPLRGVPAAIGRTGVVGVDGVDGVDAGVTSMEELVLRRLASTRRCLAASSSDLPSRATASSTMKVRTCSLKRWSICQNHLLSSISASVVLLLLLLISPPLLLYTAAMTGRASRTYVRKGKS